MLLRVADDCAPPRGAGACQGSSSRLGSGSFGTLSEISMVCRHCDCLRAASAALLNQILQLIFIPRHKQKLGASFCKGPRRRKTDSAGRASDHDHLLFKRLEGSMHLNNPVCRPLVSRVAAADRRSLAT